jgi:hypothetical protein
MTWAEAACNTAVTATRLPLSGALQPCA